MRAAFILRKNFVSDGIDNVKIGTVNKKIDSPH